MGLRLGGKVAKLYECTAGVLATLQFQSSPFAACWTWCLHASAQAFPARQKFRGVGAGTLLAWFEGSDLASFGQW